MRARNGEANLVADVAAQDDTSFERFFADRWGRLFRALLLLTGSAQEAEDLAQGAFLKLLERWDHLDHVGDLDGYLFRTALNARRSLCRRSLLAARRTLSPGNPDEDPFEQVAAHERAIRLLLRLTPRQRAAIVLTGIEGFGYREAAAALGIKEATVRALVSQARARLEQELETDDARRPGDPRPGCQGERVGSPPG
jgi:RNA polymerase sigma factor (sigma-70 family)